MNSTVYKPEKGSVAWKVIEFLTTNPEEILTAEDVAVKFEKPRGQVHSFLSLAANSGVLKREEDLTSGDLVYRLGYGCPDVVAKPALHPVLPKAKPERDAPARRRVPFIDVKTIEVRKGVPLPGKNSVVCTDWVGLLDRMTDVGDSVPLPKAARSSISKCINAYTKTNGRKFTVRQLADGSICVWRIE